MPYHIDEENSELAFEVREGNKLVIKIKSNIFSDSLELYLIKVGDNTEPTDKNVFSSLRVLKEIENLHDTILKEINSVTSGFWELKQDSQGNEYISTKYNVLTEGGLTTYGLGEQKLGTIYDGLPIDNDTIYWEEVEGSRVLKAKGSGGGSTGLDETKLWNVLGTPGDQQIDYSHLRSAFSQFSNEFVTINTEQEITALKHFTAGLSVGESKKKIYEENGVVYIDADVAVTGAMTFYATAGRTVSTIMDAVTVDGITIKKENNVLKAVSGAGSSFDENAMWVALATSNSEKQIDKSHITTALTGYATESWVSQNYATASALASVSNKLNDFLEGSDTDEIINKWKELEAFLSGMAETDNLAEMLETKADKKYVDSTFVTLATKQTITGEKTFSSVLNTAAIKASGEITTPSLAASDHVTIAGIKLRKLEDGALMLEGNLALTGALTMYASNGQSFDTIYDGLPIDNDTIYWQEVDGSRVLKAREGSGSSFDKSAMWTALAGSTTEQINKSHLTTALTGYATESWVSGKNYAVKATTLAGYGITDAYTKTESDNKYPTKTGSGASGTWSISITGNAGSSTKLQTARTLWGRSFDGTANVSGNLDNVGNITLNRNAIIKGSIGGSDIWKIYTKEIDTSKSDFIIEVGDDMDERILCRQTYWNEGRSPREITLMGYSGEQRFIDVYINGIRLHKTADGVLTLEGNLAVTGGITAYAIDPVSASTIMDAVAVDGITIKKENNVLKAVAGAGSSFDENAMWSALASSSDKQINKSHLTTALTGYATEIWVTEKGYITSSALNGYATESWVTSKNYAVKATTLAGYGITDAYTKTESDNKYPSKTGSGASGTWGINVTGNAGSATKLQTTCNLWGHSFNGQQNISGDLTGVGKIKYNNGEYFDEYGNMHLPTSLEKNYWTIFNSNGAELIKVNGIGGIIGSAFRADNWYRSTGNTGWQNETYGGGWYMQDSSYIRSYNNKSIHIGSGSYISANGGYKVNNDANTSEVWNCRYIVESLSVPAGNVRNILGWYDSSSSGYTTSYIIGSKREVGNNWGELMLGVYQYEDAKRSVAVYMGLDGAGGRVYIGGNLLVTGGGTFYGSDIRYKSIMQQVNLSLLDIANAPSFVYHWNKEGMKRDRLNLGGSAQYTQSILPWAVEEKENFLSMDYATVAYTFAVHTARHLLTYETRTDKKIKKLENRVKYLEKQLKKLGYEEVRTLDDSGI